MSLCRYLPTPSDRMAVMWTLLNVGQAVVLEYGPAGTTHYSMGLFGNMGISPDQTLFTTHMSEDDVVMGDVTRLEDAIVELDRNYSPKVIFVIASAITAVIGTDLIGVCAYMQERGKARLALAGRAVERPTMCWALRRGATASTPTSGKCRTW